MDSVWTFWADVTPLLEGDVYRDVYRSVPEFRREKADRIHFVGDRALSIGAWRLYMLAAEYLGVGEECPFNLSHSGGYALVSIGPKGEKVGCDVEKVKGQHVDLAKRFFCQGECDWIGRQQEEDKEEAFCRLWVLKESFMKATRLGMKLGLDTFEFEPDREGGPYLKRQPGFISEKYYFKEAVPGGGTARAAVCATCPDIREPQNMKVI